MTPLLLTAWTIAAAQDAPVRETPGRDEETEAPLALPVDQVHAPVPDTEAQQPSTSERPLAIPGRGNSPQSAARLQALKQYQRERIGIGTEVQFHASGPPVSVGFGGPWYGMRWGMVVANPYMYTSRTHGIYKGTVRMDVPTFLGEVGQSDLQHSLQQDILRANRYTTVWNVVTGIGVTGLVVGSVGMSAAWEARSPEYGSYYTMASTGLLTTITGLIGSSITSSKSVRLRRYPSASMGINEAEQLADAHNEQLRQDLGLSAEDVWSIESQSSQRR